MHFQTSDLLNVTPTEIHVCTYIVEAQRLHLTPKPEQTAGSVCSTDTERPRYVFVSEGQREVALGLVPVNVGIFMIEVHEVSYKVC